MMATMYRADHVGSFLRPQEVLDAHEQFGAGKISEEQMREIEDAAILKVLDLQKRSGIEIFTDGEYRRSGWAGEFPASVDGYVNAEVPIRLDWRLPDGSGPVGGSLGPDSDSASCAAGLGKSCRSEDQTKTKHDRDRSRLHEAAFPRELSRSHAGAVVQRCAWLEARRI